MAINFKSAEFLAASRLNDGRSDADFLYEMGIGCSTGAGGREIDLVEAHKWFNLAAMQGHSEAALCRSDIAEDMTAREIALAQREARAWLRAGEPRAA